MTLIEQITEIHAAVFEADLHEYHKGHVTNMVNDLVLALFTELELCNGIWGFADSVNVRAVKLAVQLLKSPGWINPATPAVE